MQWAIGKTKKNTIGAVTGWINFSIVGNLNKRARTGKMNDRNLLSVNTLPITITFSNSSAWVLDIQMQYYNRIFFEILNIELKNGRLKRINQVRNFQRKICVNEFVKMIRIEH